MRPEPPLAPRPRDPHAVVTRDPITTSIAAALVAAGVGPATASFLAHMILATALSMAMSVVQRVLISQPKAEQIRRELQQESSLPLKRHVYGQVLTAATPAPWKVKGQILYGCLILNSRPSEGRDPEIWIDARPVELDSLARLRDFDGPGAAALNDPFAGYVRLWLGLGDQSGPPAALREEAGDLFEATDAWAGLTVLWCRLDAGPNAERMGRWPSPKPQVTARMTWSRVWDPRDPAQDPDDPASWAWSANQALCALDAHRMNPVQPWQLRDLDLELWQDAIAVADEDVPLASGETQKRYEVHYTLAYRGQELQQLFQPLLDAGAAQIVTTGGRTGIVPGAWRAPDMVLDDIIGSGMTWEVLQKGREVANTLRVTYVSAARNWETAELPPIAAEADRVADGGVATVRSQALDAVTDPVQAARIGKIMYHEMRAQKRLTATAPPTFFDAIAGAVVGVALPAPFARVNGTYRVESATPGLIPEPGAGVAMQVPLALRETSEAGYLWSPEEEPEIADPDPAASYGFRPEAPASLAAESFTVANARGDGIVGARLSWPPSAMGAVAGYQLQMRPEGDPWEGVVTVDPEIRNATGQVFARTGALVVGLGYDFRVRAVGPNGVSPWTELPGHVLTPPPGTLPVPVDGRADLADGTVEVSFRLPNDPRVAGIVIWSGASADTGAMTPLAGPLWSGPNAVVAITDGSLDPGETRVYAARSLDGYAAPGPFSAPVAVTLPTS